MTATHPAVMPGLDPGIHQTSNLGEDGLPGQARQTERAVFQVTQRPGCSSLATSVSTLTIGSQATASLRSAGLVIRGPDGALRACLATGMRIRIEVSASASSRRAIVRVWPGAATAAERSVLAARLMAASDSVVPALSRGAVTRSRPHATAPKLSEMATAAKIPLESCVMCVDPSPI